MSTTIEDSILKEIEESKRLAPRPEESGGVRAAAAKITRLQLRVNYISTMRAVKYWCRQPIHGATVGVETHDEIEEIDRLHSELRAAEREVFDRAADEILACLCDGPSPTKYRHADAEAASGIKRVLAGFFPPVLWNEGTNYACGFGRMFAAIERIQAEVASVADASLAALDAMTVMGDRSKAAVDAKQAIATAAATCVLSRFDDVTNRLHRELLVAMGKVLGVDVRYPKTRGECGGGDDPRCPYVGDAD